MQCLEMIISGRVQGVTFRYSAKKQADKLGIVGYVKNVDNGKVEIMAQGTKQALDDFKAWCISGPEYAQVDHVEEAWTDCESKFTSFNIE